MIRVLFFVLAVSILASRSIASNDNTDLKLLRKKLILAIDNPNTADSLYSALSMQKPTPLTTAYIGVLGALKAKHAWNPYSKIKYLNVSEKMMQKAVVGDPRNIEIRFMRFSIQNNVPGFLGYGKDLISDREVMIDQLDHHNYGTADRELTVSIIKFLLESKRCSAPENDKLRQQLIAIQ